MIYKNKCVACGARIPARRKHYNKYGNYCVVCTRRATRLSLLEMGEMTPERIEIVNMLIKEAPQYYKGPLVFRSKPVEA
ncbi:MAG: hypothetical protein ACTSQE_06945 [Candidatus Heimdallarchaeaceae archaeon]